MLPTSDHTPHILCLVSCLLNSWRPSKDDEDHVAGSSSHGVSGTVSALNPPADENYQPHSNLVGLAKRLIELHNEDSNLCQVALVNLLFRSVGGGKECDLPDGRGEKDDDDGMEDNEEGRGPVILEEMDTEEWAAAVTDLVDEMRHRPSNQILICADPLGAVHQSGVSADNSNTNTNGKKQKSKKDEKQSTAVREYRRIYTEFWYLLSSVGLTHGGMATNNEDANDATTEGEVLRLDAQLVKSIMGRLIELSPVGQPDVRAGACLAALSASHAVLDHSVVVLKKLDVAKRQLGAAAKKGNGSGGGREKAESLKRRVESLNRTLGDLEEVVDLVVQGLFVHRYR